MKWIARALELPSNMAVAGALLILIGIKNARAGEVYAVVQLNT